MTPALDLPAQSGPTGRDRRGRDTPAREILDSAAVGRTIDRIAHQILEKTDGGTDLVLLGIPTRGAPLARRLADRIATFTGLVVPVGALDVTLYRDDLRLRAPRALETTDVPAEGVDGRRVILVDDVLFSGRTIRAALDALSDLGRPRTVQLAVLVDRGHRELPIRADYVGKNLPTARTESVRVLLAETDGRDAVLLAQAPTPGDPDPDGTAPAGGTAPASTGPAGGSGSSRGSGASGSERGPRR